MPPDSIKLIVRGRLLAHGEITYSLVGPKFNSHQHTNQTCPKSPASHRIWLSHVRSRPDDSNTQHFSSHLPNTPSQQSIDTPIDCGDCCGVFVCLRGVHLERVVQGQAHAPWPPKSLVNVFVAERRAICTHSSSL